MKKYVGCFFSLFLLLAASNRVNADGGTVLNDNTLVTRTNVDEYADLSLDLRDIRTFCEEGNEGEAKSLYNTGLHAQIHSEFRYPLKKLSTDLADLPKKTPLYLFHLYGLSDQSTSPDELNDMSLTRYADNYVEQALHSHLAFAPEVITAMSMWMYATHLLYDGIFTCQDRTSADSPDMIPLHGGGMDEFIATWIGDDQPVASDKGHGLYAWAQKMADVFDSDGREAKVNSQLKLLYQEGAAALSFTDACSNKNTGTVQLLYSVAVRMVRQMMVPLFQHLLYSIEKEDNIRTLLYARALVPQIARCRPSLYKLLKGYLMDDEINFGQKGEIIAHVQDAYGCFGLACADIGTYSSITCDEQSRTLKMAGYMTSTDVSMLSRFDIDVRELSILSQLGFHSDSFTFAKLLYLYGSNVEKERKTANDPFELISLHDLAVGSDRNNADPVFRQFVAYYNDKTYADKEIMKAFDGGLPVKNTVKQRAAQIVLTSVHQVIFMSIIGYLQGSVRGCEDADPQLGFISSPNPIDQAAALLIGSAESDSTGGSTDLDDGQLLWNLANERAFQFGTDGAGYASVNSEILDNLYAAKAELATLDCEQLKVTTERIRNFMLIPLGQSVIRAASMTENLDAKDPDVSLVEGDVFAKSMLPLISEKSQESAELVNENMLVRENIDTVRDGAQVVGDAIGYFFQVGLDIRCQHLGYTSDVDPCKLLISGSRTSRPSFVAGYVTSVLMGLVVAFAF